MFAVKKWPGRREVLLPSFLRRGNALSACWAIFLGVVMLSIAPGVAKSEEGSDNWVRIVQGRFVLQGKSWLARGVNYMGSWRHKMTIDTGDGAERFTIWALYHDYDDAAVSEDFAFLRAELNATAVRMALPAEKEFENLVRQHDYAPWYGQDGSIAEPYRSQLIELADNAFAHGLRIQFCLLWNVRNEIVEEPDAFAPGGRLDKLYAAQVRSVALALNNHPGAFAFSIGNETLAKKPTNGVSRSRLENVTAEFIARRIAELRVLQQKQLVTLDEGVRSTPFANVWSDGSDDGAVDEKELVNLVDYLGPHFYPVTLTPEDDAGSFATKIEEARRQLSLFASFAKARSKPVVFDEVGLRVDPTLVAEGRDHYSSFRNAFMEAIVQEARTQGVQGILAWDALPALDDRSGAYKFLTHENSRRPWEFDQLGHERDARRILHYEPSFNLFLLGSDGKLIGTPAAAALAKF